MQMTSLIMPVVICFIIMFGMIKGVDVFSVFLKGAREGLDTCVKILPALIGLITAVTVFRASGALMILTNLIAPVANLVKIPPEVVPLALMRPISGSGSLAVLKDILSQSGADSEVGRIASTLMGSTETTFYTIAVYYSAAGITKARHTAAAALSADLAGFVMSALAIRILF